MTLFVAFDKSFPFLQKGNVMSVLERANSLRERGDVSFSYTNDTHGDQPTRPGTEVAAATFTREFLDQVGFQQM